MRALKPRQLSPVEAQAFEEACAMVARGLTLRDDVDDVFFGGAAPLQTGEAGPPFARYCYKLAALAHPQHMTEVCSLARAGDRDADLALRELIFEITERGEKLPTSLAAYMLELIHPNPAVRGRRMTTNLVQDAQIAVYVFLLIKKFRLKPRRQQERRESACSILSRALVEAGIGRANETVVEKIWGNYRREVLVLPDLSTLNAH